MSRALAQAKMSEAKFPKRSLVQAIRDANSKASLLSAVGGAVPPLMVECVRASLHNGRLGDASDAQGQMLSLAGEALMAGAVAIGANADYGTFRGQYEDLETLKLNTQLPVFCNDFVVYGYQLFRAKSSGADAVKLMASVLSVQDIAYNIKVGKALGIMCIVVVSSKSQLLDVLAGVPDVQAISVSSRNMRLWKVNEQ
jgi:indole-3-glycerol phosphate synthase